MSVFDAGVLRIENGMAGAVLHYHLISRALLLCFLALPQNSIDKFLGAPAPEQPKDAKDKKDAKDAKGGKDKEDDTKKPSPTPAYVFAGIFAALYLVGRVLEDKLVQRLFRKRLLGS